MFHLDLVENRFQQPYKVSLFFVLWKQILKKQLSIKKKNTFALTISKLLNIALLFINSLIPAQIIEVFLQWDIICSQSTPKLIAHDVSFQYHPSLLINQISAIFIDVKSNERNCVLIRIKKEVRMGTSYEKRKHTYM